MQVVISHKINGLKGQGDVSPGQRPGKNGTIAYALKGQKNIVEVKLLPLQGDVSHDIIHRALPCADSSMPLRGAV